MPTEGRPPELLHTYAAAQPLLTARGLSRCTALLAQTLRSFKAFSSANPASPVLLPGRSTGTVLPHLKRYSFVFDYEH